MNLKKIILTVLFLVFVVFVGFSLYWVFFRSVTETDAPGDFSAGDIPIIGSGDVAIIGQDTGTSDQGLPWQALIRDQVSPVASGGLTEVKEVVNNTVKGLLPTSAGLQYYDADKQQFFRLDENGNLVSLSDRKFFQVEKVTWDNYGDKAILEYPDGMKILYDFRTQKQVTLPRELENFSFNSSGTQIAAKWQGQSADYNWLIVANEDGSGMRLVEPLGENAHTVQVGFSPDNQVVALHSKATGLDAQEVYPLGMRGENFKSFAVSGAGFTSSWSPQGNSLLYSVYNEQNNYNPNLWITKGNTSQLGDLKVSLNLATWPEKCTFAGENNLYCAVPQGLPRGAGLFPEIAHDYPDNFYSVNLTSGQRTMLASPVGARGGYSAYNLFLSADGSLLYFTDAKTGTLQSIRLR
ncbi:MAG: hypothetical protein PHO91_02685 [Patescibacteria group bacterium]|nr:hypothetical protein [Patescibacteria group bacterium]